MNAGIVAAARRRSRLNACTIGSQSAQTGAAALASAARLSFCEGLRLRRLCARGRPACGAHRASPLERAVVEERGRRLVAGGGKAVWAEGGEAVAAQNVGDARVADADG